MVMIDLGTVPVAVLVVNKHLRNELINTSLILLVFLQQTPVTKVNLNLWFPCDGKSQLHISYLQFPLNIILSFTSKPLSLLFLLLDMSSIHFCTWPKIVHSRNITQTVLFPWIMLQLCKSRVRDFLFNLINRFSWLISAHLSSVLNHCLWDCKYVMLETFSIICSVYNFYPINIWWVKKVNGKSWLWFRESHSITPFPEKQMPNVLEIKFLHKCYLLEFMLLLQSLI